MKLESTEALLQKMIEQRTFDTYALLVHCKGEEKLFFSENANGYTYFDVASMGKVLVASTLVLQAIGKGLLSLDDTIDKFFDAGDEIKNRITVKQMLTHTSGIQRKPLSEEAVAAGRDGIAAKILSYPLLFTPGTNCKYSCNAFILLGLILEKIYGKTLEEIYTENLARPLGFERTSFEIALDEPNAALCYRWKDTPKQRYDSDRVLMMGKPAGSGGQQSCLFDIQKFIKAILKKSDILYPEELFSAAETNYTSEYSESRGLGYVYVDKKCENTGDLFPDGSFGHAGSTGQCFYINREEDLYVILLTNACRYSYINFNFEKKDWCTIYAPVIKMRSDIHNAIRADLCAEGLLHI